TMNLLEKHPGADYCLIVDATKLFVSKHFLSMRSPVFSTVFESEKEEFELEDVDLETFTLLLYVLYRTIPLVTVPKLMDVIELAHRLEMKNILEEAEDVIFTTATLVPFHRQLLCGDRYGMEKLKGRCMQSFSGPRCIAAANHLKNCSSCTQRKIT
ncbi:hypothetical protein PFISCL1PPCAC_11909, partial [Pristionchus fissidentatus]